MTKAIQTIRASRPASRWRDAQTAASRCQRRTFGRASTWLDLLPEEAGQSAMLCELLYRAWRMRNGEWRTESFLFAIPVAIPVLGLFRNMLDRDDMLVLGCIEHDH